MQYYLYKNIMLLIYQYLLFVRQNHRTTETELLFKYVIWEIKLKSLQMNSGNGMDFVLFIRHFNSFNVLRTYSYKSKLPHHWRYIIFSLDLVCGYELNSNYTLYFRKWVIIYFSNQSKRYQNVISDCLYISYKICCLTII